MLFAGKGRLRLGSAEIDPPEGADLSDDLVEHAARRCLQSVVRPSGRHAMQERSSRSTSIGASREACVTTATLVEPIAAEDAPLIAAKSSETPKQRRQSSDQQA